MSNLILPGGAGQLYIPGKGLVPPHIRSAMKAVEEYDPELSIGRNERNGEWVVLYRGRAALGLGTELPSADRIKERLYKFDTKRRGKKIVDELERKNQQARDELSRRSSDGAGALVEAFEYGLRKKGVRPQKVFVPKGVS